MLHIMQHDPTTTAAGGDARGQKGAQTPRGVSGGAECSVGTGCRHGRLDMGVRLDVRALVLPINLTWFQKLN